MNITVEREPNCAARLRVEVPAEDVRGQRQQILQSFTRQARIPGFRPGKVPAHVIEKRFGEQIAGELESRLARQAFQQATESEDLRILDAKPPQDTVHHPDGAVSFTSVLILAPEFELPEYKGITLEIPDRKVTGEDIDAELDGLRKRFADFTDVEDRPLQEGDFAVVNYSSTLNGKPLDEAFEQSVGYLAGGTDYWLEMKEDSLLPGFSAALAGAQTGEEREFSLVVPEEFPVEELRGVTLDFKTALQGIKLQSLPDLDDALAAQVMPGKTLAELREMVEDHLKQQLERQLGELKVNQLLERLTTGATFDLPTELVSAETQGQADQLVERGLGSGLSEDQIESQQGEIFAAASQRAQMSLRTDFLLQRITEKEEIALSDAELSQRVAAMAQQSGKPPKTFAKELQQNGRLQSLRHQMLLSKAIDFLLEHAKVETVEDVPTTDD